MATTYENLVGLSTIQVEQYRFRPYLNAEHAARRFVDLTQKIVAFPGIDPGRPTVQCSPSAGDGCSHYIDEKWDLEKAFLAAAHKYRVTEPRFRVWLHVRIKEGSLRDNGETSKTNAGRWVREVDQCVDSELDARGMLASSKVRSDVRKMRQLARAKAARLKARHG